MLKSSSNIRYTDQMEKGLTLKVRTNLNDLLKRREDQKQTDRKKNLLIISGASAAAAAILALISL